VLRTSLTLPFLVQKIALVCRSTHSKIDNSAFVADACPILITTVCRVVLPTICYMEGVELVDRSLTEVHPFLLFHGKAMPMRMPTFLSLADLRFYTALHGLIADCSQNVDSFVEVATVDVFGSRGL
jgi:hypothetical protein